MQGRPGSSEGIFQLNLKEMNWYLNTLRFHCLILRLSIPHLSDNISQSHTMHCSVSADRWYSSLSLSHGLFPNIWFLFYLNMLRVQVLHCHGNGITYWMLKVLSCMPICYLMNIVDQSVHESAFPDICFHNLLQDRFHQSFQLVLHMSLHWFHVYVELKIKLIFWNLAVNVIHTLFNYE